MSSTEGPLSYARGFKLPKKSDVKKALGTFDDHQIKSVFTETFCETFDGLPLPKKLSDWLAQYVEKGQTYTEYLQLSRTLHTPLSSHRKTIYLTLFGQIDKSIFDIDSLMDYTQRFFQMPVKLINPFLDVQWNEEKNQWTCTMSLTGGKNRNFNLYTRYNEETKHSQICVTEILNLLKKVVPDDARCLVALTMYDLYGNDTDLFIAGFAMGNCRVGTFSLYRYDPYLIFTESDWFDCKIKTTTTQSEIEIAERQNLLLLRACRLLTHEICHLFGIDHCIYYSCLMNGSGDLEEDFSQPLYECPIDLRKLHTLIKFDIQERYEQLLEFFKKHNFHNEINVVERKLDVIKHSIKSNSSPARKITQRKRNRNIRTMDTDDNKTSQTANKYPKYQ